MNKKFTLIELITVIVIIGILSTIVAINIGKIKDRSITSFVQANEMSLQTAVDTYFLKNNTYAIVNNAEVTIEKPQLLDVKRLVEEGYVKKNIDLTKVSKQYYWIDAFGKVWGATEPTLEKSTLFTQKETNTKTFAFSAPKEIEQVKIYEVVNGKKITALEYELNSYTASKDKNISEKIYIKEQELVKNSKDSTFEVSVEDPSKVYLISGVDKYGLETVPVGIGYDSEKFKSIENETGEFTYILENGQFKKWIDFMTIENTPNNSKIEYEFAVKEKLNGTYGEWQDDFYSLPDAYGIKVKIKMIEGDNKVKPSLYDLRILYSTNPLKKPVFLTPLADLIENEDSNELKDIEIIGEYVQKDRPLEYSRKPICPVSNLQNELTGNQWNEIFIFELDPNSVIEKIVIDENVEASISIYENGQIKEVNSYIEVPAGECFIIKTYLDSEPNVVNIRPSLPFVYQATGSKMYSERLTIKRNDYEFKNEETSHKGGYPKNPDPKELPDYENWVTMSDIRFFNTGVNEETTWYRFSSDEDVIQNKTRVIYRFAMGDGEYWLRETSEFPAYQKSRSLMIHAYLQVHKDFAGDESIPAPKIKWININSSEGSYDVNLYKPQMLIYPEKNNNQNRSTISNTSQIKWKYEALDPYGAEITNIEWRPTYNNETLTYPLGRNSIAGRVQNEYGDWSDWVTYSFVVKEEKPVANFELVGGKQVIEQNKFVSFNTSSSYDPDGDKIVEYEWKNKKNSYSELGDVTVSLRVKDSEGNWSDWVSKTYLVDLSEEDKQLTFSGLGKNAFDFNDTTKVMESGRAIVTWNKNISGKTLKIVVSDANREIPLKIKFRNERNQDLIFYHKNGIGTTIELTTGDVTTYYVKVPNNASHLYFERIVSGINYSFHIHTIELVNEEDVPPVSGLTSTPNRSNATLSWNPVEGTSIYNIYRDGTFETSVTGTSYTTIALTTSVEYNYSVIAIKGNALSDPVSIKAGTIIPYVNFSGQNAKIFDYNDGTYHDIGGTGGHIYWDRDITGKTLKVVVSNAGRESTLRIHFRNKNNQDINFYHATGGSVSSVVLNNSNTTTYYVKVPEGANSLFIFSYGSGNYWSSRVHTVELVNEEDVPPVSGLTSTPNRSNATLKWNAVEGASTYNIYRDGTFEASVSATSYTTVALTTSVEYNYSVIAIKGNALSDSVSIKAGTIIPYVNFSGQNAKIFDYNDGTYHDIGGTGGHIYWDRDITGKTLKVVVSNAGRESTLRIHFRNKNNQDIIYYHSNGGPVSSIVLNNSNRTTYYIQVPEGANSLFIFRYGAGNYWSSRVHTVELVNEEDVPTIQNLTSEILADGKVKFTWNNPEGIAKVNIFQNGNYINYTTTNSFTTPVLTEGVDYKYDFAVVKSNAISDFVGTTVTR